MAQWFNPTVRMRDLVAVRFAGAFGSGLDVDQMAAAIAAGLGGALDSLLGVLQGVCDDLRLGLLALLADFLADDTKWRGVLTDFHGNSPHFARSTGKSYPFRYGRSITMSDISRH